MGEEILLIVFGMVLSALPLLFFRDIIIRYFLNNLKLTKCIKIDDSLLEEDIKPFYNIVKESVTVLEYIKGLPENYSDATLDEIISQAKSTLETFDMYMAQKQKKEEIKWAY